MIQTNHRPYNNDEMLQLSGIQHFVFCPRQWALIQVEQQWAENLLTTEGGLLHANVDNPFLRERNSSNHIITLRGIRLSSASLGFNGIADAIEIRPNPGYESLPKPELLKSRQFSMLPVEYKRGRPKLSDCDRLQVVAQAMILEEMLDIKISRGAVYYWETRHREYIEITETLRASVTDLSVQMHDLAAMGHTPPAIKKKGCSSCSLVELCLPQLLNKNVSDYLKILDHEKTS